MIREHVSRLRHRLPPGVVRVLRGAALGWGWLTADLRTTPSLIVVGAQRAGTTTMFRLLSSHPGLVRPTLVKGTGYFDDQYHHGPRWYRAHFPLRLVRGSRIAFECSGYYLFHPLAPERIARDLPDAHVVIMVRDPVARAYSAYRHETARGFESLPFDEAVACERARTRGERERLVEEPRAVSFEHRHHAYLQRGEYAGQVSRYLDALGPGRVHVVDADALFADPLGVFTGLQRELGLEIWRPEAVGRWNERPGDPLPQTLEDELRRHFETHDQELARLIGRPPSWRKETTP